MSLGVSDHIVASFVAIAKSMKFLYMVLKQSLCGMIPQIFPYVIT